MTRVGSQRQRKKYLLSQSNPLQVSVLCQMYLYFVVTSSLFLSNAVLSFARSFRADLFPSYNSTEKFMHYYIVLEKY